MLAGAWTDCAVVARVLADTATIAPSTLRALAVAPSCVFVVWFVCKARQHEQTGVCVSSSLPVPLSESGVVVVVVVVNKVLRGFRVVVDVVVENVPRGPHYPCRAERLVGVTLAPQAIFFLNSPSTVVF